MNSLLKRSYIFLFAALFITLISVYSTQAQTKEGWKNLKYSIFFTNGDVERLVSSDESFKKTMAYFAPIKISKVYLEGKNRGNEDVELMKKVADRFRAVGIVAAGAMVPTSDKGGPCCYNDLEDMAALERRMRAQASVFDEIILDDWLFTICNCEKCLEGRGNMSWGDYRTKLILEKAKKYIIDPAKEVNPKVKVIIKYPDWQEGHRQNGYDVFNETNMFDNMAVGIETRVPEIQDQHIPIYSGYIFQKWWSSVDMSKWIGSWLDNYQMNDAWNEYNAQVWQAILAKTPEIILWCAGQLVPPNQSSVIYPHFVKLLPQFDKVAGMLKSESRGVPIYLPYGSTGEYNIFGYLGMAGIPLEPVAKFPTENQVAIFTLNSLKDNQLAEKMIQRLKDGHDVFMTWDLWKKVQDSEFKNTLSLNPSDGYITTTKFRTRENWNQKDYTSSKPITFPRIQTTTWPYVRDVAAVEEDYDLGIFLDVPYLKGKIYILNMPDNSSNLLQLPAEVLNMIRRAFDKELGFTLQSPGKVASYLFGKNQYVLYNMGSKETSVSLRFTGKINTAGWKEIANNSKITVKEDTSAVRFNGPVISDVSLKLKPYEIAVVEAP